MASLHAGGGRANTVWDRQILQQVGVKMKRSATKLAQCHAQLHDEVQVAQETKPKGANLRHLLPLARVLDPSIAINDNSWMPVIELGCTRAVCMIASSLDLLFFVAHTTAIYAPQCSSHRRATP